MRVAGFQGRLTEAKVLKMQWYEEKNQLASDTENRTQFAGFDFQDWLLHKQF